jgi:hypothetical protein
MTAISKLDETAVPPPAGKADTDYYIRGIRIPKYKTAMAQVVMVGIIALCTV